MKKYPYLILKYLHTYSAIAIKLFDVAFLLIEILMCVQVDQLHTSTCVFARERAHVSGLCQLTKRRFFLPVYSQLPPYTTLIIANARERAALPEEP